jgi:hypothetical protein
LSSRRDWASFRKIALESLICKVDLLKALLRLQLKRKVTSKPIRMPDLDEILICAFDL